jgi:hypothetical protein
VHPVVSPRKSALVLALAISFAGCGSSSSKDSKEARDSFAGKWTRGDGLVFSVDDDGKTVTGKLLDPAKQEMERYTFSLAHDGAGLSGKATIEIRDYRPVTLAWKVQKDGARALVAEVESGDIWPDGHIENRHLEKKTFTLEPPSESELAAVDEARRLRDEADQTTTQAQTDEEARKALQSSADSMSEQAEKDEAEMQRLRAEADALLGETK